MWTPKSRGAIAASQPKNFRSVIPDSLLSDDELKTLLEQSQTDENKDRIKKESKDLVDNKGAFGFVSFGS